MYNEGSGNVYMRGTPEYNAELARRKALATAATAAKPKNNVASLREELEGYTLEELIKYYHTSIDPDQTEDLVGLNEEDLIEKIIEVVEVVEEQSGGKRRRRRQRKTRSRHTRKTRNTRRHRKNRRN